MIPKEIALIIQQEMESDLVVENYQKKKNQIGLVWDKATKEQKTAIDEILMCLTGWTFATLCRTELEN